MTRDHQRQLVLPRLGVAGRHVVLYQTRDYWLGRQNSELNRIVNMAIFHFPKCHDSEGHCNNNRMESALRTCRLKTFVHHSGNMGRGNPVRRWTLSTEAVEEAEDISLDWRGYDDIEQGPNGGNSPDLGRRSAFGQ